MFEEQDGDADRLNDRRVKPPQAGLYRPIFAVALGTFVLVLLLSHFCLGASWRDSSWWGGLAGCLTGALLIGAAQFLMAWDYFEGRVVSVAKPGDHVLTLEVQCYKDVFRWNRPSWFPDLKADCDESSVPLVPTITCSQPTMASAGPSSWTAGMDGTIRELTIFGRLSADEQPIEGDIISYRNATLRTVKIIRRAKSLDEMSRNEC